MQVFTLEHLIKIERVASRAINASKAFAEGTDRQLLEDLTTLISEIRHAASCTQEGEISIADLWVSAEARTNTRKAAEDDEELALGVAVDAAYRSWSRGDGETMDHTFWAEFYNVDAWKVRNALGQKIRSNHLDNQPVRA